MPRKTRCGAGRRRAESSGFNEAAARCRGKQTLCVPYGTPRPGFNEAAARCRGKRPPAAHLERPGGRFNEAAARCRGKRRPERERPRTRAQASMRPRPDAAENAKQHEALLAGLSGLQ